MTLHHRREPSARYIPRAEMLEDRCTPAVSILTLGRTMFILGDSSANTVEIKDQGDGTINATITSSTNTATRDATRINSIVVLARGGADTVKYELGNPLTTARALLFDLGAGNDAATLNASAGVSSSALLAAVYGGEGIDDIQASIGTIAYGAYAGVALDGGAGDDSVAATFTGQLDGALALAVAGGLDNDKVSAVLDIDPGSTGYLAVAALGGSGDDNLTLNVNDNSGGGGDSTLAYLLAVLDGGAGTDTCVHTDNVAVFNCDP